jgi:hypothetical protein
MVCFGFILTDCFYYVKIARSFWAVYFFEVEYGGKMEPETGVYSGSIREDIRRFQLIGLSCPEIGLQPELFFRYPTSPGLKAGVFPESSLEFKRTFFMASS